MLETRVRADNTVRRRRMCKSCGTRWRTSEQISEIYKISSQPEPDNTYFKRLKQKPGQIGLGKWSKLSDEVVIAIYKADRTISRVELANRFGVSVPTVRLIQIGQTHQDIIKMVDGGKAAAKTKSEASKRLLKPKASKSSSPPQRKRVLTKSKATKLFCADCNFCENGCCTMDIPEYETEGPRFAEECSIFIPR